MNRSPRRRRRYRRRGSKVITVLTVTVLVLAVCVLGLCAYKLIGISSSYKAADDAYDEVSNLFVDKEGVINDGNFNWDYDKLLALCEDAVGYIYQPGVMSYPIVQGEDNDEYLRSLMNGEYNVAGTIFVDAHFPEGLNGKYSIVYGHNMYNESMFGPLSHYSEKEYFDEHPYFDIYIGYKGYRYYVFSTFVADADGQVYTYDFNSDEELAAHFAWLKENSAYDTGYRDLTADDHVIVLSTCVDWHDYDYRNVVCLVRGEEILVGSGDAEDQEQMNLDQDY